MSKVLEVHQMGFIRKRSNGSLAFVFMWKGKRHTKNLGTASEAEANQIKQDAEDQLDRNGCYSALQHPYSPNRCWLTTDTITPTGITFRPPGRATEHCSGEGESAFTLSGHTVQPAIRLAPETRRWHGSPPAQC